MRINLTDRGSNQLSGRKAVLAGAFFVVAGLIAAGFGYTHYQTQTQGINNSVNITGTVVDTNIERDSSRRGGVDYHATVSFDYSYEGTGYTSSNAYPGEEAREFNSESKAESYMEKFEPGEKVNAYVNPENPGKAFLYDERSGDPMMFMAIGGFMALLGSYTVIKNIV